MVEAQRALTQASIRPHESAYFGAERAPYTLTTAEVAHRMDVERVDHREPDAHADAHGCETRHDAG